MYSSGKQFTKRAMNLFLELKANNFPNAQKLSKTYSSSARTWSRLIEELTCTGYWPISYDSEKRGYYLTDPEFQFSPLPPGKEELTALLLMRQLAENIDDVSLLEKLDLLWDGYRAGNSSLSTDLERVMQIFSTDSTEMGVLSDQGILKYIDYAVSGAHLDLTYKSPWTHPEPKLYQGQVQRLHFSDSKLYMLFLDTEGKERVLNCSFIISISESNELLKLKNISSRVANDWLKGFGVWAGEDLQDIKISIMPPAAEYYAKVIFDDSQEDEWDGGILVRRFKAMISPELKRKILGLGSYLIDIKPEGLKVQILEDVDKLVNRLRS